MRFVYESEPIFREQYGRNWGKERGHGTQDKKGIGEHHVRINGVLKSKHKGSTAAHERALSASFGYPDADVTVHTPNGTRVGHYKDGTRVSAAVVSPDSDELRTKHSATWNPQDHPRNDAGEFVDKTAGEDK